MVCYVFFLLGLNVEEYINNNTQHKRGTTAHGSVLEFSSGVATPLNECHDQNLSAIGVNKRASIDFDSILVGSKEKKWYFNLYGP